MKVTSQFFNEDPYNQCIVKVWDDKDDFWPWLTFMFSKDNADNFMKFWGKIEQERLMLERRNYELEIALEAAQKLC